MLSPNGNPKTLRAVNLTKRYSRIPVADGLNFEIRPGEIFGLLGPNGSGKSTTIKMIVGLLEPSAGSILYAGADIRDDLEAFKARLGYVPEEAYVYNHLSGREYLELVGRLRGMTPAQLSTRVEPLLDLFDLTESRHSTMDSYSKGMRQRVLLASALLHNPEILILDEPVSGLDVTSVMIFREMVQTLARSGKIVILSSHEMELVEKLCSRVMILYKGQSVAYAPISELREMQHQPSLEGVFAELAIKVDVSSVASRLVEVIT